MITSRLTESSASGIFDVVVFCFIADLTGHTKDLVDKNNLVAKNKTDISVLFPTQYSALLFASMGSFHNIGQNLIAIKANLSFLLTVVKL